MPKLEPCPFCGGTAAFERLGTNRQSCIVNCENCGARMEANETGEYCGNQWNRRHFTLAEAVPQPSPAPVPQPTTSMTAPETDIQVSVKVIQDIKKLGTIAVVLVLVTGLQAGIAIKELLVRFGVIGG